MTLRSGSTHDIVVHLPGGGAVGLTVQPSTYRISQAPQFAPQMTVGNLTRVDLSWLRSYKFTVERGLLHTPDPDLPAQIPQMYEARNVVVTPEGWASIAPAAYVPTNTTQLPAWSSSQLQLSFVMSQAPRLIVQGQGLITYTGGSRMKAWVVSHTNTNGISLLDVKSVVMHSNVAFMTRNSGIIVAYGNTGANGAARPYLPVYTNTTLGAFNFTQADLVFGYDKKLWKTLGHRVAYWEAGALKWGDWLEVGDATWPIITSETFIGRKFFGKVDGLWTFDAGRIYQVEDYSDRLDETNFTILKAYKGALYYNIGTRLYRYTAGGSIEELPWPGGKIFSCQPAMGLLLLLGRSLDSGHKHVWAFNSETGVFFPIMDISSYRLGFTGDVVPPGPTLLAGVYAGAEPQLLITPLQLSGPSCPQIAMMARINEPLTMNSWHARSNMPADIEWPEVGFDNPTLIKYLVRVKLSYSIIDPQFIRLWMRRNGYAVNSAVLAAYGCVSGLTRYVNVLDNQDDAGHGQRYKDVVDTNEVYFAGTSLFDSLTFAWHWSANASSQPSTTATWQNTFQYWNGTTWATLPVQLYDEEITIRGIVHEVRITFVPPGNWARWEGASPGDPLESIPRDTFVIRRVWTPLSGTPSAEYLGLYRASIARNPFGDEQWDYIGTFSDTTKFLDTVELTPPVPFTRMVLRAQIFGQPPVDTTITGATAYSQLGTIPPGMVPKAARPRFQAAPVLKAVECEYTIPESPKLQVSARVVVVDALERLDGVVENSAGYTTATLFSLWQSGAPHTVQLPMPPPTAHTRNMVVSITPPGVTVPVLAYGHSSVGIEVPIQLREV